MQLEYIDKRQLYYIGKAAIYSYELAICLIF